MNIKENSRVLGWKEWLSLPDPGIQAVKVKIDTGAGTSALHAFRLETFSKGGGNHVRFWFQPAQKRTDIALICEALLVNEGETPFHITRCKNAENVLEQVEEFKYEMDPTTDEIPATERSIV